MTSINYLNSLGCETHLIIPSKMSKPKLYGHFGSFKTQQCVDGVLSSGKHIIDKMKEEEDNPLNNFLSDSFGISLDFIGDAMEALKPAKRQIEFLSFDYPPLVFSHKNELNDTLISGPMYSILYESATNRLNYT